MSRALYTGLSGLLAQSTRLDVIGNNIANVSTIAFKASDALFSTTFAETLRVGSGPSGTIAGINPSQIGLGAQIGSVTQNFASGTITPTGIGTHAAIAGEGFFVLSSPTGGQMFSRDGAFDLDAQQNLVNSSGLRVLGFMANDDFEIVPGTPVSEINVPLGSLSIARATTLVELAGNMDSSGDVATTGSMFSSQAYTDFLTALPATGATLLTNVRDGAIVPFAVGDIITMNAELGGRDLQAQTYTVTPGSTVTNLMDFMREGLGIDISPGQPNTPGVTISPGGTIDIEGNIGTANDIDALSFTSTGAVSNPMTYTRTATADGESAITSFTAYDSLGNPMTVTVTLAFEAAASGGNTWRWFARSINDTDLDLCVGCGTLTFSDGGLLFSESGNQIQIDRVGLGSETPILIDPDFGAVTQLAASSQVTATFQDGAARGTLVDFAIGDNGIITGIFTNGLTASLAQLAVAAFTNQEGLIQQGSNMFGLGPNSGMAQIGAPGEFGTGTIVSNALESSNVDLANEFVNLVVTSTGFNANTRVISTASDLLTQLLNVVR